MDDLPLEKIAILGPTLASMIQRLSSSAGDVDGLIFGHINRITTSILPDDSPSGYLSTDPSSDSPYQLVATITNFLCSGTTLSFYDSLGLVDPRRVDSLRATSTSHLLGWFSARRKTPSRPSMREFSVTSFLSSHFSLLITNPQNPNPRLSSCLFLLFTTPLNDQFIHTHEYRAYQFCTSRQSLDPRSVDIVNIGPAFRGHYGSFIPSSPFPSLGCELRISSMSEDRHEDSLSGMKQAIKDQREIDACADGFQVAKLNRLLGSDAANYTGGVEDLYEKMLTKIESVARLVEESSAKVFEQENHNRKLRYRAARLE